MEKKFKRVFALLLAGVMAALMTVTSFAAVKTHKLSVDNPATDHVYTAYQIFTGDYATVGGVLKISNAKYGADINPTFTLNNKSYSATVGEDVPEEVLDYLAGLPGMTTSDPNGQATADEIEGMINANGGSVLPQTALQEGYYFVKDTKASGKEPTDTYSTYIAVNLHEDTEITLKKAGPTSEKKVMDVNDTTGDITGWQDSADYDIGDDVPFRLKATVASDYADYTKGPYKLTFHDKQSAGLTFKPDSVVVKVDGNTITSGYEVKTGDKLSDPSNTFEIHFANLKNIKDDNDNPLVHNGSVITVEYKSTLNSSAVIGAAGNPNESKITFTNDKNDDQGGEKGSTEWDKVIVFTYQLDVNKLDEDQKPLAGAGFTLYKEMNDTTLTGLKTGAAIKAELAASNASIRANALKDASYYKEINFTTIAEGQTAFDFKGIDDGTYVLVETKIPSGYNAWESVEVTVTATHDVDAAEPKLTSLTVATATGASAAFTVQKAADDTPTGYIATSIVNYSGSVLPSTGGMGTTIFYILGGLLVLGAVVVIISKKRTEE